MNTIIPKQPTMICKSQARGKWLSQKINENGWTTGAELGVEGGSTYLYILSHCSNIRLIGVDIWAPKTTRDAEPGTTNWDDYNSGVNYGQYEWVKYHTTQYKDRAILYRMLTSEAVTHVEDESLDFVFVDANHDYQGVYEDIEQWIPKVKTTGWVIGHDINLEGVKQAIDEKVPGYIDAKYDNIWYIKKENIK